MDPFRVRCAQCNHVWTALWYPTLRMSDAADVLRSLRCPKCGASADLIYATSETKDGANAEFAAFVSFNGERQRWTDRRITYAQAVANCTRGAGRPEDIYTVSYSTPGGRDGTLRPGQDTEVVDGMVIDAGITGRA